MHWNISIVVPMNLALNLRHVRMIAPKIVISYLMGVISI